MMKKLDTDFEEDDEEAPLETSDGENFPTAVYTVYNVHGEPIGHRLYSFQPVYEPEDEDLVEHHEDTSEYEDTGESDHLPHMTVLKGGMFPDHDIKTDENAINKLKHQYFERYVDKRKKRFLSSKNSEETNKELDIELQSSESNKLDTIRHLNNKKDLDIALLEDESKKIEVTTKATLTTKPRIKRGINIEEYEREVLPLTATKEPESTNEINNDMLKVIPLESKVQNIQELIVKRGGNETANPNKEKAVLPLQYNNTNSTEVGNILDKRDKRTSRKTDRLNQTTATVPKT